MTLVFKLNKLPLITFLGRHGSLEFVFVFGWSVQKLWAYSSIYSIQGIESEAFFYSGSEFEPGPRKPRFLTCFS